ncbi:MAG: molybdenum ABC transporter ATP-binding protein [Brevundimonas sp.]|uniref:molybdenum ABC transporter ATP-binding protein n=1 Tax=Brevundimonas sp. TaxID=1871086 RepID=UPI00248A33CC|nr:molybdenum ABC transporter ATP-binding protein [Brevundimonas sp.]MDI1328476.1 molybdenum ABC transporter ATP-binding protein [Brevundimonas sp.]
MLEVSAHIARDDFSLEVGFSSDARITCLFGRSGAGKTTVAELVAGLIHPVRGRVLLDGEVLFDSDAGLSVPAWKRRIGYVFQDARLFPHMTVRDNLLYGPRRSGELHPALDQAAALLGLEGLLERRPGALSGGEARRVAIGRALLTRPRLLILDEPLAGLDGARRGDILPYLDRLARDGPPILYVSHSVEEVARLADRVVLVGDGRAVGAEPPDATFDRLEAEAAAGLSAPLSILNGRVTAHDPAGNATRIDLAGIPFLSPLLDVVPGERLRVVVDARDVALALTDPIGASFQNRLPMRIAALELRADGVLVRLEAGGLRLKALVTRQASEQLGLAPGTDVIALVKATAAARYA